MRCRFTSEFYPYAPARPVAHLGSETGTPVGGSGLSVGLGVEVLECKIAKVRATSYLLACIKSRQYFITAIRRQRLDRAPGGIVVPTGFAKI
jgi:hypothetical protein